MDVKAIRNDDTGHIELGVEDDGQFVALATMPTTQFDSTVANLKAAEAAEGDKAA
jgi:hypothetical protein